MKMILENGEMIGLKDMIQFDMHKDISDLELNLRSCIAIRMLEIISGVEKILYAKDVKKGARAYLLAVILASGTESIN